MINDWYGIYCDLREEILEREPELAERLEALCLKGYCDDDFAEMVAEYIEMRDFENGK